MQSNQRLVEIKNQCKNRYKELEQYILPASDKKKKGKTCPLCGSGSGSTGTGITEKNGHYKCWACGGIDGDIFSVIGAVEHLPNFMDQLRWAADKLGIEWTTTDTNRQKKTPPPQKATEPATIAKVIEQAKVTLFTEAGRPGLDYLHKRGLTDDNTIKQLGIGYAAEVVDGDYTYHNVIVYPLGGTASYNLRGIGEKKFSHKPTGSHFALFNQEEILNQDHDTDQVFMFEGEADAITAIQAGYYAVAINSVNNYQKAIDYIHQVQPKRTIIIAFDNDLPKADGGGEAGQKAAAKAIEYCNSIGVQAFDAGKGLYKMGGTDSYTKDLNDLQQQNAVSVAVNLDTVSQAAWQSMTDKYNEALAEYEATSVANCMAAFDAEVERSKTEPIYSTGFRALDEAIGGGLMQGLYVLGAPPSLGKTTFAMQIMEEIAAAGNDTLVFSLEMPGHSLMGRGISRQTFLLSEMIENTRYASTELDITQGRRYGYHSNRKLELIAEAKKKYSEFGKRIHIYEGKEYYNIANIAQAVKKHIDITGRTPVVFIDYLQVLAAAVKDGNTDKNKIDIALSDLYSIINRYHIPLLLISSYNRGSYKTGGNIASFSGSSNIEYAGDVNLTLEYRTTGTGKNDTEEIALRDQEDSKEPRELKLKFVKNRRGPKGVCIYYRYFSKFSQFSEEGGLRNSGGEPIRDNSLPAEPQEDKGQNTFNRIYTTTKQEPIPLADGLAEWQSDCATDDGLLKFLQSLTRTQQDYAYKHSTDSRVLRALQQIMKK